MLVETRSGPLGGLREPQLSSHKLVDCLHGRPPTNWTSVCTGPQLLYVEFCEELVYGTVYDTCLKSLMAKTTDVRSLEKKNMPA